MNSIYLLKEQTQGPNGEQFNGTIDGTICRERSKCIEWIFCHIVKCPDYYNTYVIVFCSLDGKVEMTMSGTMNQLQRWFEDDFAIVSA